MTKGLLAKKPDIMACYKLLEECISFDHIEDRENICKNLREIKYYREDVSEEAYKEIEAFIEEMIKPIVYDVNYFDFLNKTEYGVYDENGHFVINSEESLDRILFEMYNHTFSLNEKLLKMMFKYM